VTDIAVESHAELREPYPERPVHLCIEITSPGERFSDTIAKCGEYHEWGVAYCWIVDPDNKRCWQYDSGGRPDEVRPDGPIVAGPIILSYADIFASV
jgi:Uma2 family endonuclease